MNEAATDLEQRILVLLATPRDASLTTQLLDQVYLANQACANLGDLSRQLDLGCGAVLIAEEVLNRGGTVILAQWLQRQPRWSDLPILVAAGAGANSIALSDAVSMLPNVTVLERPMRVAALLSTVRTALRARRRQYDLRSHLQRLRDSEQRKDEFLAILAHELRNPLAPLRNALTLLQHPARSAEAAPLHRMMERQVDTMVRLVDDLLEVSRISRGLIELRPEPLDLLQVVRRAVETSRPLIEAAHHRLHLTLPPSEVRLRGDPVRLAQIFCNLLNNAAKYTPDGGQIHLEVMLEDREVCIRVRDTGIGLSADAQQKVFDLFMQVRDARFAAAGGLGIGLTLVRTLVELHGGQVHVESAGPGQGSSFVVRLPRTPASPATTTQGASAPSYPSLRGRTGVIVDDNRDAADSLALNLELFGIRVKVAYSGVEGYALVAQTRPDFAILDLGMAGMDGLALARQVRMAPTHSAVTLIALTGWGQDSDRELSQAAGFDHHLVKPVAIDALLRLLETSLAHRDRIERQA